MPTPDERYRSDPLVREAWLAQSRWLGADAALASASWLTLTEDQARSVLDDVDPMVMDAIGEPNLSGEFADDLTPNSLAREVMGPQVADLIICAHDPEIITELADAWEAGRDEVWDDALQGYALRLLGDVIRALEVEQRVERAVDALRQKSERKDRELRAAGGIV